MQIDDYLYLSDIELDFKIKIGKNMLNEDIIKLQEFYNKYLKEDNKQEYKFCAPCVIKAQAFLKDYKKKLCI